MSYRQEAKNVTNPRSVILFTFLSFALCLISINLLGTDQGVWPILFLILVQATPILFAITTGRTDFISLVMFNQLVSYSLAKLNQLLNIDKVSAIYPETLRAINELTICAILILVSYYTVRAFVSPGTEKQKFVRLNLTNTMLHTAGLYCTLYLLFWQYMPKATQTLMMATNMVFLIFLFSSTAKQAPRMLQIYKLGAFLAATNIFLRVGALSIVGMVGGILFVTFFLQRRRINIALVLLMVTALCVVQPVKGHFRRFIRHSADLTVMNKLEALQSLIAWKYLDGDVDEELAIRAGLEETEDEYGENKSDNAEVLAKGFARIGDDSLERVLSWTPSKIPFWGGESYQNIPYILIPRFVWPDKPEWSFWNKFGRTYGFLSSDDFQTSVGIGYLGEAYMNFGYLGMYACALFMGILIAVVERLAFSFLGGNYMIPFICYISTVGPFHYSMGPMINGIILVTALLMLLRPSLKRMRRLSPA